MADQMPVAAFNPKLQQLDNLCGMPVRLTILDPETRERIGRVPGVLSAVGATGLMVDCLQALPAAAQAAPVTVEVLMNGDLIWWHSTVDPEWGSARDRVRLVLPESVQSVQRRRHPRVDMKVPVHLLLKVGGEAFAAVLRDLSAGGASLLAAEPMAAGERVQLVFELGSGLFFQDLEADTVRCTDAPDGHYNIGIKFYCGAEQEAMLTDWVNRQLDGGASATGPDHLV